MMWEKYGFMAKSRLVLAVIFACLLLSGCGSSVVSSETTSHRKQQKETDFKESQPNETLVTEWFYHQFDQVHRDTYDAFRKAAEDPFSGELTVIRNDQGRTIQIAVTELDSVYQGFLYDHPELFWLDRSYRFRVCGTGEEGTADAVAVIPRYGSAQEITQHNEIFLSAAEDLLNDLEMTEYSGNDPGMIYDLLTGHTAYTEEALYDPSYTDEHTAYGAIVEKSAVCDGYALALKYLMNRTGIECIVIPGSVYGAAHVWNTAYWDGTWHEMDITWDASEGTERQYFDLTTEEMERDHCREAEGIGTMIPVSTVRDGNTFRNKIAL